MSFELERRLTGIGSSDGPSKHIGRLVGSQAPALFDLAVSISKSDCSWVSSLLIVLVRGEMASIRGVHFPHLLGLLIGSRFPRLVVCVLIMGTSLTTVQLPLAHIEFKQDLGDLIRCMRVHDPSIDAILDLEWNTSGIGDDDRDSLEYTFADLDFESFTGRELQQDSRSLNKIAQKRVRGWGSDNRYVVHDELVFIRVDDLKESSIVNIK